LFGAQSIGGRYPFAQKIDILNNFSQSISRQILNAVDWLHTGSSDWGVGTDQAGCAGDQIIGLVTATTLVAYPFYTFAAKTAVMHDGRMLFTVPFVFYFIVRYLYLIHVENRGGAPDELLLKDRQLLATSLLWMVTTIGLIYIIPASS